MTTLNEELKKRPNHFLKTLAESTQRQYRLEGGAKLRISALTTLNIDKMVIGLRSVVTVVWQSETKPNLDGEGFHRFVLVAGGILDD